MVSTPLPLANLKLLSVVNSDSQRTVTAALVHATKRIQACVCVCVHMRKSLPHEGSYAN